MYTTFVRSARGGTWRLAAVLGAVVLLALFAGTHTASAQDPTPQFACVGNLGGRSCTASDVSLDVISLRSQGDACIGGNIAVVFEADLVANAHDRWDFGMFISLTGESAQTGTSCYIDYLHPTASQNATNYNPNGGPYWNNDGDTCGDGQAGIHNFYTLPQISIPCIDTNGDGLLDPVNTCVVWDNNVQSICTDASSVYPGTPSKCSCGAVSVNPPVVIRQIIVKKVTDPSPDPTDASFIFSLTGGPAEHPVNQTNILLKDGESHRSGALYAGTYSVAETPVPGWDTTWSCTDGNGNNNIDPAAIDLSGAARIVTCTATNTNKGSDLGIVKAFTGEARKSVGEQFVYTLDVTNYGPAKALDVIVDDPLPTNLSFTSTPSATWTKTQPGGTTSTGSCDVSGLHVTCHVGDMDAPSGGSYATVHVDIPVEVMSNVSLYNRACTWSNPAMDPDPDTTHPNCSSVSTIVPVTLASFKASRAGQGVHFEWSTAMEVGNAGFNLYVKTDKGRSRINQELILPHTIDAMEPQDYTIDVADLKGDSFYLEDVSNSGITRLHGPFQIGKVFGGRVAVEPVDWKAVKAENDAKSAERLAAGKAEAAKQTVQAQMAGKATSSASATSYPTYQLRVSADGLYRITYEQLQTAGLDLRRVPLASIALTNRGAPVPIRVVGATSFGPGSFIEFYGRGEKSLYTKANVYVLSVDPTQAARIPLDVTVPDRNAQPPSYYMEKFTVDKNLAYSPESVDGDPWYETYIQANSTPASKQFVMTVDQLVPAGPASSLTLSLWGLTDYAPYPDHHLKATLNGVPVGDWTYDARGVLNPTVQLPAGLVVQGNNTLVLTLPGDTGAVTDQEVVDKYGLTYPRAFVARNGQLVFTAAGSVFEVNGLPTANVLVYRLSGAVTQLTGAQVTGSSGAYTVRFPGTPGQEATYMVTTVEQLAAPQAAPARAMLDITTGPAQYLVISHPNFISGLQPLVQARQAQGLTVKVVSVDDVYGQFNYGIVDPKAIRDYIAYAKAKMGTSYVLLVGGDTYDPLNYQGTGAVTFIPSPLAAAGPYVMYAPADPIYADVNGDGAPEVALGRLPVRTAADLTTIVNKTLAYATKPYGRTAVFAADLVDGSTSFTKISNGLMDKLPPDWTRSIAYLDALDPTTARSQLTGKINQGVALVSYVGHSSYTTWSYQGLFTTNDAAALTNAGKPTVVVQWGCWNTYYLINNYTVGDKLLFSGDKGAAAVFGSTALTLVANEEALGQVMLPLMTQPGTTIGAAMTQAKTRVAAARPGASDVLLGWALLGDPALIVQP